MTSVSEYGLVSSGSVTSMRANSTGRQRVLSSQPSEPLDESVDRGQLRPEEVSVYVERLFGDLCGQTQAAALGSSLEGTNQCHVAILTVHQTEPSVVGEALPLEGVV